MNVIAEGSFPQLRRILNRCSLCDSNTCVGTNKCDLQTFLPQLLINKGNQLTHIEILRVCNKSIHVVWKALKQCKAARNITLFLVEVGSAVTVTYEDMEAICHLPNLQRFLFSIAQKDDDNGLLRAQFHVLLESAVKENTNFQVRFESFEVSYRHEQFTLYRINI